ncbi:MAG: Rpn family recombination-promoting nuclease/putative transposase [Trichormus sp. ATA11-4-KO1]|nr:Rpn family recombination-promoting nuclease/putative transposase [Trichormus sp. ATA11-4-KO1]
MRNVGSNSAGIKTEIYSRLFSEIFLYIRQYKPLNPWQAVVIYPTRNVDTADRGHHAELLHSHRVQLIHLDELGETASLPIGIATIRLVIENEETAITTARELINRTRQEIDTETKQQQLLELIETILVYKFPSMNREEIESMFSLSDLKQTKVYQEAKQEGIQEGRQEGIQEGARQEKLKLIPLLLKLGLSVDQIAQELNLQLEDVQQELHRQSPNQD